MSRLEREDLVYATVDGVNQPTPEGCQWFAKCENFANGIRQHPMLGSVPICQRCDDKVERLGA